MKFGIFGDVHGNLEALEAVMEDMQTQGVTHCVCIGDIVGFSANPRECLEIVRALGCPVVKGDHDEVASSTSSVELLGGSAMNAIRYTRLALTKEQRHFLGSLPLVREVHNFTIVHASLDRPDRWGDVCNVADAEASLLQQKTQLCFFGHTHLLHVFIQDSKGHKFIYKKITLLPDKKYFVNVGSVGQPCVGDWRAAYAIYDLEAKTIELRRIPYDLKKAQNKLDQMFPSDEGPDDPEEPSLVPA